MNILKLTAENPDELLNAGAYGAGAIIRVQSGAAEAGPFSNETTAPVVAGTRSYTVYDTDGASTTWYRTRYENAGGTITSDWSPAFQVGDETAGLLCSIYDVKQRVGIPASDTSSDEDILEFIRQVSTSVMGYTGRRFARTPSAGVSTFLFDVPAYGRSLAVPAGLATVTQLEVATYSQPGTGGTYTVVPTTDWDLRPLSGQREYGWPATSIVINDYPTGSVPYFYPGRNVVRITGALGWDRVPADIQGVVTTAVLRRYIGKEGAGSAITVGPDGGISLSRDMTPADAALLDWYRVKVFA